MSRGLGKLQRQILDVLRLQGGKEFSVDQIMGVIFGTGRRVRRTRSGRRYETLVSYGHRPNVMRAIAGLMDRGLVECTGDWMVPEHRLRRGAVIYRLRREPK